MKENLTVADYILTTKAPASSGITTITNET